MSDSSSVSIANGNFSQKNLSSFPPFMDISQYESLDFSFNPINSLETLPVLPLLESLNLEGTKLDSFSNAQRQPTLKSLNLINTPISFFSGFKIMSVIIFGSGLTEVNGQRITPQELAIAEKLLPRLRTLLLNGWILTNIDPPRLTHYKTQESGLIDEISAKISSPKSTTNEQKVINTDPTYSKPNNKLDSTPKLPKTKSEKKHRRSKSKSKHSSKRSSFKTPKLGKVPDLDESEHTNNTLPNAPPLEIPDTKIEFPVEYKQDTESTTNSEAPEMNLSNFNEQQSNESDDKDEKPSANQIPVPVLQELEALPPVYKNPLQITSNDVNSRTSPKKRHYHKSKNALDVNMPISTNIYREDSSFASSFAGQPVVLSISPLYSVQSPVRPRGTKPSHEIVFTNFPIPTEEPEKSNASIAKSKSGSPKPKYTDIAAQTSVKFKKDSSSDEMSTETSQAAVLERVSSSLKPLVFKPSVISNSEKSKSEKKSDSDEEKENHEEEDENNNSQNDENDDEIMNFKDEEDDDENNEEEEEEEKYETIKSDIVESDEEEENNIFIESTDDEEEEEEEEKQEIRIRKVSKVEEIENKPSFTEINRNFVDEEEEIESMNEMPAVIRPAKSDFIDGPPFNLFVSPTKTRNTASTRDSEVKTIKAPPLPIPDPGISPKRPNVITVHTVDSDGVHHKHHHHHGHRHHHKRSNIEISPANKKKLPPPLPDFEGNVQRQMQEDSKRKPTPIPKKKLDAKRPPPLRTSFH